jgi:hypothetical protein
VRGAGRNPRLYRDPSSGPVKHAIRVKHALQSADILTPLAVALSTKTADRPDGIAPIALRRNSTLPASLITTGKLTAPTPFHLFSSFSKLVFRTVLRYKTTLLADEM